MKKANFVYEPHLVLREHSIAPRGEWKPEFSGLTFIQIRHGTGYFLKSQLNQELSTGTVLLIGANAHGTIRASQIGDFSLIYFNVLPSRLTGLMTLGEQRFLESILASKESSLKIFAPQCSIALRMEELAAGECRGGLGFRLSMLQLLAEVFDLETGPSQEGAKVSDAGQRLELFLKQTPISDLLEMNFNDLAQMTNCTSRHLSRLFQKLVGMSFNDKRAELRLARAIDLLATSNIKVVDVALESGFKSLSQFNQVFARRFGVSPGRWRQKNGREGALEASKKLKNFGPVKNNKLVFKLNASRKPGGRLSASELSPVSVE
jgi:AraC-like DNA-binding protein